MLRRRTLNTLIVTVFIFITILYLQITPENKNLPAAIVKNPGSRVQFTEHQKEDLGSFYRESLDKITIESHDENKIIEPIHVENRENFEKLSINDSPRESEITVESTRQSVKLDHDSSIQLDSQKPKSKFDEKTYTELLLGDYSESEIPNENKREAIKSMMSHAFTGYRKYAWGWTALDPARDTFTHSGPFGNTQCGATIIDSLDTLHIMGLMDDYTAGVDWLLENFENNFMETKNTVSVFEITIRYLGGFLAAYFQSDDERLLKMAKVVADGLLPAFDTKSGMPMALVSPKTKKTENYGWANGGCGILADMGTIDLEFKALSHALNDQKYSDLANKVRESIKQVDFLGRSRKPVPGLYPLYIDQSSGKSCGSKASIAAMGDSFYEYLLKSYVMDKNDVSGKEMYQHTLESFDYFLKKTSQGNYFLSEYPAGIQKMEHLACFAPGMLALGTLHMPENTGGKTNSEWLNLAGELTKSCHMMYEKASTGVGPNEAYSGWILRLI